MQLSRPVHGSSSSSTVAELVFEEAMLPQLYKARIQPARLDADGKLLSGLNQTFSALKQAPASDQSKATFKTRLKWVSAGLLWQFPMPSCKMTVSYFCCLCASLMYFQPGGREHPRQY
jgi:hypothetical protein